MGKPKRFKEVHKKVNDIEVDERKEKSPSPPKKTCSCSRDLYLQVLSQKQEITHLRSVVRALEVDLQAEKNVRSIYQKLYQKSEIEKKRKETLEIAKFERKVLGTVTKGTLAETSMLWNSVLNDDKDLPSNLSEEFAHSITTSPETISLFDDHSLYENESGNQFPKVNSLL